MIESIYIRPRTSKSFAAQARVIVVAGKGIEGDRYFDAHDEPGQNVTFVEAEEIEAFAALSGEAADYARTGRNIVTRGVRLNELLGREFSVGGIRFRGVELCEPCLGFGKALATPQLETPQVVKHWVHRAGLRADALSDGELVVGAAFELAA